MLDLGLVPIANTKLFQTYGRNAQDPHPVHGATTSNDNPGSDDKDSMSFGVDSQNEWKCWTHSDGRSALQLIAVIKRIRDWECGWRDAGSRGCATTYFTVCNGWLVWIIKTRLRWH